MSLASSPSSNGSQTASQLIPPASKLAYHERIYGVLSHNPSTLPSESLK
jgi:hypothetical protein